MVAGITPYQFQFCPASYIHKDHVPVLWCEVLDYLPEWRTLPAYNKALLDELELPIDFNLPTALGALALFPDEALGQLVRYLGAVLHGEAIRQCLQGNVLRQIISSLGRERHTLLLTWLDLLIGSWPTGWQKPLPAELDSAYLEAAGLSFWFAAVGEANPGWSNRLVLRLPASQGRPVWDLAGDQLQLARGLCLKIAKQVTPQCYHLLK